MRAILYPSGLALKPRRGRQPARKSEGSEVGEPVGGVRGKVVGFSRASARRLRLAFLSWERPDFQKVAFTLTVREHLEPEAWRSVMEAFRKLVIAEQFSLIWRIELQKRGTPHLHGVVWVRDSDHFDRFRVLWLQASGQSGDAEAEKFACAMKVLEGPEWLAYCAAHASKTSQLGWVGRQWGIWGKRWLIPAHTTEVQLTPAAAVWLVRLLKRWKRCRVNVKGFTRVMCGSLARRFVCASIQMSGGVSPQWAKSISREDLLANGPEIPRERHGLPF